MYEINFIIYYLLFIIYSLSCYMFTSYDHLQAEIYTPKINTTDNGSVIFRILVNLHHLSAKVLH
jgi:hypothetical protein